eukprot:5272322-Pyramimonas_sp.AAC.1
MKDFEEGSRMTDQLISLKPMLIKGCKEDMERTSKMLMAPCRTPAVQLWNKLTASGNASNTPHTTHAPQPHGRSSRLSHAPHTPGEAASHHDRQGTPPSPAGCLLYTSDAADDTPCVDL